MAVFPDEDRESYPDMFKMPEGCYEVSLFVESRAAQPLASWLSEVCSSGARSCTRLPRAPASLGQPASANQPVGPRSPAISGLFST